MGKINRDIGFFLFSFFISLLVVFIFLFIYCSCFSEPNDFCFVIDSNLSKADEVSFETEAKKYILMYPNNTRVLLFRNPASENKSYKEVCKFLQADKTDKNTFLPEEYICINYAADVVNSAERNGIACCLALVLFDDSMEKSHTLNIFMLEDGRKMYVDTTGSEYSSGQDLYFFSLTEGEEYREMGTIYEIYEFW